MKLHGGLLSFSPPIPYPCYGDAAIMVHMGPLNPIGGGHPSSFLTHIPCGSSLWPPAKVQRLISSAQKKRPWFEARTWVLGCKAQWPCRARPAQFIAATYCWVRGRSGMAPKIQRCKHLGSFAPINIGYKSPQSCDLDGGAVTLHCPAPSFLLPVATSDRYYREQVLRLAVHF